MNLNNTQWMNVVFFVKACCCMMVARKLLLGTTTILTTVAAHTHATVATNSISSSMRSSLSSSSSSSLSVTIIALTAGGRTLIEIGNNNSNSNSNNDDMNNQQEFEIDVSYLDNDYENGLLILQRRVDIANTIGIEDEGEDKFGSCKVGSGSMMVHTKSPRSKSVLHKISMAFKKNPFVASSTCTCILLGNIASMIGIIPIGLSGFVPAVSIMATVGILHKK